MQTILFLQGLPASGKTTYAKALVAEKPQKWVRLNKDDLRLMLHDGVWSHGNEAVIIETQHAMARSALSAGRSVIIDDTNFAPKHAQAYRQMANDIDIKAEFVLKTFDTDVEECLLRDSRRPKPVGRDVIVKMYYQYCCAEPPAHNEDLHDAIIVDLDGTLAIVTDRSPYDWQRVLNDKPNWQVMDAVASHKKANRKIIIVSGRDGRSRADTEKWLAGHGVVHDMILMRPPGTTDKDVTLKRQIYEDFIRPHYNVYCVYDDRPCIIRMWRGLGLFVFDCGKGVEF